MAEGMHEADKLKVFISYSRDDLHFDDQRDVAPDAANNGAGFEAILDRHGISGAEANATILPPARMIPFALPTEFLSAS